MNILLIFPGFILAFIIVLCYELKIRRTEPKNKVHFYVARDKNGRLFLYIGKPVRSIDIFSLPIYMGYTLLRGHYVFKYFGLNENDYANLTWEDEPVEVFLNLED